MMQPQQQGAMYQSQGANISMGVMNSPSPTPQGQSLQQQQPYQPQPQYQQQPPQQQQQPQPTQQELKNKEEYARRQQLKAGKERDKKDCCEWIRVNFIGVGALEDSAEIYRHAGKDVVDANLRVLQEDEEGLTEEDREAISEHQSASDIPLFAGRTLLTHRLGQGVAWYEQERSVPLF